MKNFSLFEKNKNICPELGIRVIEDSEDPEEKQKFIGLKREMFELDKYYYLDDKNAQIRLFAEHPEHEGIVGVCSLMDYSGEGTYIVSGLVLPDFEGRGIASLLLYQAVDYAFSSPDIKKLFAVVEEGLGLDKKLGREGIFHYVKGTKSGKIAINNDKSHYSLDTRAEEELPAFDFNNLVRRLDLSDDDIVRSGSVLGASKILDCRGCVDNSKIGAAKKSMSEYFNLEFRYPRCSEIIRKDLDDISGSVAPNFKGIGGKLIGRGQTCFYRENKGDVNIAVMKKLWDNSDTSKIKTEPILGIDLYQLSR